ncbi:GAF and ANTAR domain-containing protein [Pseudonocardia sp. KRD291]|uniref:GAF and ANTAR domain-containing protein n=1 Tax=Pseudonocardia sp. KRD291 TaxID=2792007 RepID=UPI001C4A07F5|nr:GAF and ANTAR domain-containing protein [Pseudonocardia sp. KRD291]MBW0100857.1 GAF and ANTAR domain-containing protein [Pseudonocardia sp. KRD291]
MSVSEPEYLADAFAAVAREMQAATCPEETRLVVTRRAVEMVPGCTYAGITLVQRRGSLTSVAPTSEVADRIHAIQNELGEGPCLSSIHDHIVYTVDDLRQDERWPRFARRVAAELPVASMLAFRLFTSEETTGALDLYSDTPAAFDAHSRAIGTVLAAHAAIAMVAARERENADNLEAALHNSRQIGIAIGILMRSESLTQDQAFDFLVNVSQRLNRKLRTVAGVIVEAGGVSGDLTASS